MTEKIKVLFVYIQMVVGGSTTSLLNLLREFDYDRYDVDLFLYKNEGELLCEIPNRVHLLPPAYPSVSRKKELIHKILHPSMVLTFLKGKIIAKKSGNKITSIQLMWPELAKNSRKIDKKYDVAVSFLEGWPAYYVASQVIAKKKIGWIHVDYEKARLIPKYDYKALDKFNTIVTVSKMCEENMKLSFPQLKDRICCIENLLSRQIITEQSRKPCSLSVTSDRINLVSVCRIEKYHKGLDRAIEALYRSGRDDISWYILGKGIDEEPLKDIVRKLGLDSQVFFLGEQINPFPIESIMDAFFLPSRYEGKPMAVTEAMMLGLPAIITAYASASEQVEAGYNGVIMENSDEGITNGLKAISKEMLHIMKENLMRNPIDGSKEIKKIYKLME